MEANDSVTPPPDEQAGTPAAPVDLDAIIHALDAPGQEVPVKAIQAARANRDAIVPKLIAVLQNAAVLGRQGITREGMAPFYALYLLAEFRAKEALPALVEAMTLPWQIVIDLFDDAMDEPFTRTLAALDDEPFATIDGLVENRQAYAYVRWNAASAYRLLVRDGRLTREEAIERLRRHLRDVVAQTVDKIGRPAETSSPRASSASSREDTAESWDDDMGTLAGGIISELADLGAAEALDDIRAAYDTIAVDESMIDLETVEELIAEGEPRVQAELASCWPTGIDDTIAELKDWGALGEFEDDFDWAEEEDEYDLAADVGLDTDEFAPDIEPYDDEADDRIEPLRNTAPRAVGRNDACPCGSGKKFKKCCGRPGFKPIGEE